MFEVKTNVQVHNNDILNAINNRIRFRKGKPRLPATFLIECRRGDYEIELVYAVRNKVTVLQSRLWHQNNSFQKTSTRRIEIFYK